MSVVRAGPALMFCPATRPERFAKALDTADAVILDLEDAVDPADKDEARRNVIVSTLDAARVVVRVNALDGPYAEEDVRAVRAAGYRCVMVPKCESAAALRAVNGLGAIALCETSRGVLVARELAASPHVSALMWGAEDLVADLGGTTSRHPGGAYRDVARYARSTVLLAARAAGKAAVDAVHLDLSDGDGLRSECVDAVASGFAATACLHPRQAAIVREVYRPTEAQVEWAREVLQRAEKTTGVFVFQGVMVDGPMLAQARSIMLRADAGTSGVPPAAR